MDQGPWCQPERPHGGRGLRGTAEYFRHRRDLVRVLVAVVAVITGGVGVLAYWRPGHHPRRRRRPSPAENIANVSRAPDQEAVMGSERQPAAASGRAALPVTAEGMMAAVVHGGYGSADVLQLARDRPP